jgi:hypothetical protein
VESMAPPRRPRRLWPCRRRWTQLLRLHWKVTCLAARVNVRSVNAMNVAPQTTSRATVPPKKKHKNLITDYHERSRLVTPSAGSRSHYFVRHFKLIGLDTNRGVALRSQCETPNLPRDANKRYLQHLQEVAEQRCSKKWGTGGSLRGLMPPSLFINTESHRHGPSIRTSGSAILF